MNSFALRVQCTSRRGIVAAVSTYLAEAGCNIIDSAQFDDADIKMAQPERDVICFTGDGTYMMANAELATAAMMGIAFTVVVTDNRGYGCINRLQMATGGAEFNNLLDHSVHAQPSAIDFAAHAASMGATSVKVASIAELEVALASRSDMQGPYVVVIDTDPYPSTPHGGTWWDVGVPQVSQRAEVNAARADYESNKTKQRAD